MCAPHSCAPVPSPPSTRAKGLGAPGVLPTLPAPALSPWDPIGHHLPPQPRGLEAPLKLWCSSASGHCTWHPGSQRGEGSAFCVCILGIWQVPSKPEALSKYLVMSGGGTCQRVEQIQVCYGGVRQALTPLRAAQILGGRSKWYSICPSPPGSNSPDHPVADVGKWGSSVSSQVT